MIINPYEENIIDEIKHLCKFSWDENLSHQVKRNIERKLKELLPFLNQPIKSELELFTTNLEKETGRSVSKFIDTFYTNKRT